MSDDVSGLDYRLVDVFSREPLSGNGLTVFPAAEKLSAERMQRLTQEMRQFESIFLSATPDPFTYGARIFTMDEELDFAGHPVLGAAAVLHDLHRGDGDVRSAWRIQLRSKSVDVVTARQERWYSASMDQGAPAFVSPIDAERQRVFLQALGLSENDLARDFPVQVVSTGLPYLIVPLEEGLDRASIAHPNFEALLRTAGAKFVYVLDVRSMEGRTWDNSGRVEDIATGSAAGPVGAYLTVHGATRAGEEIVLHQGRFAGRPGEMRVQVDEHDGQIVAVRVAGDVCMVASGTFRA